MIDIVFYSMTFICLCICVICVVVFLRKTPFQLGGDFKCIWSLLFYKDLILIVIPIFLLFFYDVDKFSSFFVTKQEDVSRISFYISFSLLNFLLFLSLFYNIIFYGKFKKNIILNNCTQNPKKHYLFGLSFVVSGFLLLIFSIFFLDYKHAFINSILFGEQLIAVRLGNVYASHLPSQISFLITISWWVTSIFCGYLLHKKSRFLFMIIFSIGVVLATSAGDKNPLIQYIMLFVLACLFFYRPRFNLIKLLPMLTLYIVFLFFILYQVVAIQVPDLTLEVFLVYLLERLGVGQMAGVYETLSLEFVVPNSWWHMVPFAGFFIDYPIFSKELMLFTEGYEYAQMGVKNSFFIAEAFGMGGYLLMFLSPIILAFAYVFKIIIILTTLKRFFGLDVARIYSMPIVFLSSNLTGDFSSFVLQKSGILIILILCIVYFVKLFIKVFIKHFVEIY